MTKLSVIIVTKNEAHNISDCLKSVAFADEIIIFDSGSTDGTPDLCRQFTDLVTITPDWPGDGPQKNRALQMVSNDWILCLDADERLSAQAAIEIQLAINQNDYAAYDIPYQSTYCGKKVRFGDWRDESHIRLFNRHLAKITHDVVHCRVETKGKIGKLHSPILHHPFYHFEGMLHKLNDYSTQSAKLRFSQGKKATLWTALSHSLWTFCRGYLLKWGFLDGRTGFLLAVSNAQGTYYRYVKLMHLCEQAKRESS